MTFVELLEHVGHDVVVVGYRKGGGVAMDRATLEALGAEHPANVSIECVDCGTVLVTHDNAPPEPVRRVFVARGRYDTWTEDVESIMDANAGYEDSGWQYLRDALEFGTYDDSEYGGVTSLYLCEDKAELRRQMEAWREAWLREHADADVVDFQF